MYFPEQPFLLRTIHQLKGNAAPLSDTPTEKWTPCGFQHRHFQCSYLENQLHCTSNTQSVCFPYVFIFSQYNFNEKL